MAERAVSQVKTIASKVAAKVRRCALGSDSYGGPDFRHRPAFTSLAIFCVLSIALQGCKTTYEAPRRVQLRTETREVDGGVRDRLEIAFDPQELRIVALEVPVMATERRGIYQSEREYRRSYVGLSGAEIFEEWPLLLFPVWAVAYTLDVAIYLPLLPFLLIAGVNEEKVVQDPPEPGEWKEIATRATGAAVPKAGVRVEARLQQPSPVVFERDQHVVERTTGRSGETVIPVRITDGYVQEGAPELERLRADDVIEATAKVRVRAGKVTEEATFLLLGVRMARRVRSEFEEIIGRAAESLENASGNAAAETLRACRRMAMDSDRVAALEKRLSSEYREVVAETAVYVEPNAFGQVAGSAPSGTLVRLLRVEEDWSRIRSGQLVGFVPSKRLKRISLPALGLGSAML